MGAWIETERKKQNQIDVGSHPTWVRGLKHKAIGKVRHKVVSHPTWVRGLKQDLTGRKVTAEESHPTWVRGLKP